MHDDDHREPHDRGLAFDLETLMTRRRLLGVFLGAAGAATLAGCGIRGSVDGAETAETTAGPGSTSGPSTLGGPTSGTIASEPAGPYPADGSNGPDVLAQSGIVRRDIRTSFGLGKAVADGVPSHYQPRGARRR